MVYKNAHVMYKGNQSACDVGLKNSVGDNASIQVMVTVGIEKCDSDNKVI